MRISVRTALNVVALSLLAYQAAEALSVIVAPAVFSFADVVDSNSFAVGIEGGLSEVYVKPGTDMHLQFASLKDDVCGTFGDLQSFSLTQAMTFVNGGVYAFGDALLNQLNGLFNGAGDACMKLHLPVAYSDPEFTGEPMGVFAAQSPILQCLQDAASCVVSASESVVYRGLD